MLIIRRRRGEKISIGEDITLEIRSWSRNKKILLALTAPKEIPITVIEEAEEEAEEQDEEQEEEQEVSVEVVAVPTPVMAVSPIVPGSIRYLARQRKPLFPPLAL